MVNKEFCQGEDNQIVAIHKYQKPVCRHHSEYLAIGDLFHQCKSAAQKMLSGFRLLRQTISYTLLIVLLKEQLLALRGSLGVRRKKYLMETFLLVLEEIVLMEIGLV